MLGRDTCFCQAMDNAAMEARSALKARIVAAFAALEYPDDWCLSNSREGTEPALLEAEFKGQRDWRALDAAFIDQAPDGYGSALSFFSDEAFRFYLPAYLLADLDGKLQQANPLFALTHGLDDASRGQQINPRRYGERTWFEYARYKFAVFDSAQRQAIAGYLAYQLENAEITGLEKKQIREALHNYWKP